MSKKQLTKPLQTTMQEMHPIHGIFAKAFERLGGVQRMEEWANENYTDFARIFAKMAPRPLTDSSVTQVNIVVNPALGPSALDE